MDFTKAVKNEVSLDNWLKLIDTPLKYTHLQMYDRYELEWQLTPPLFVYKGHTLISYQLELAAIDDLGVFATRYPQEFDFQVHVRDNNHVIGPTIPSKGAVHFENDSEYGSSRILVTSIFDYKFTDKFNLLYLVIKFAAQNEFAFKSRLFLTMLSNKGWIPRQADEWLDGELDRLFTEDGMDDTLAGWVCVGP